MPAIKDDTELFGKPFFGDSRLDRMMGIVFALAGEVAVLKADVARLSGKSPDENAIDVEMQRFAREVLKPLVDSDFDASARQS